jgi:DNA-binding response OmpR family regulator
MTHVLVVDDSPQILATLRLNLRARDSEVVEAPTGQQALTKAAERPPDLVILRRKLERDPSRPRHLITEPGMGYRFDP